MKKNKKIFSRMRGTLLLLIVLTIVLTTFLRFYKASIDHNAFGAYGDFFGGVVGTIFVILSVYVVYKTYKSQEKNKIESRFFELLKLHQDNLIRLKSIDSNIFSIYIDTITSLIKHIKNYPFKTKTSSEDIVKLGYILFFEGVSTKVKDKLAGITNESLRKEVSDIIESFDKKGINYSGTYSDLGIYFRQLFQTVTYINDQTILNYNEKYNLIKILRVRLNIEEQYLLFLNSLVNSGLNWGNDKEDIDNELLTKYNLLKNIPREFKPIEDIDFYKIYPEILYEFESNDNEKRKKREKLEKKYS